MPSPCLAAFHEDILREILAYLLVDTPRASRRAAVLSTCRTLNDVGLPLLCRVVDLRDSSDEPHARHVRALFGQARGLLTQRGRVPGLNVHVVELRYGGPDGWGLAYGSVRATGPGKLSAAVTFGDVRLPRCSHLTIGYFLFSDTPSPVQRILPHLPITDLIIRSNFRERGDQVPVSSLMNGGLHTKLGMSVQPPAWHGLKTITFDKCVLVDHFGPPRIPWDPRGTRGRLSLGHWKFKVVVIDLTESDQDPEELVPETLVAFFLEPPLEGGTFLQGVERIELKGLEPSVEEEVRKVVEETRRRGPDRVRERLLPLVVFVGVDGEERKLVKDG